MSRIDTLKELFLFNDWGRDRLMAAARPLTDGALDRPFEMGPGSLRKTLHHLAIVEEIWLRRWLGEVPSYDEMPALYPLDDLTAAWRDTAARRNALIDRLDEAGLSRSVSFTTRAGDAYTLTLGELMLHVVLHGVHHRAQITNMLRHVGAELPKYGADYIFMRFEMSMATPPAPPPMLDLHTIRRCFAHADWCNAAALKACGTLADSQLDRKFDMGMGSLRATMAHILDAENWWHGNWTVGPEHLFPDSKGMSLADVATQYPLAATRRNDFISTLMDTDLTRTVRAMPRPGVIREFPLGVTLLQVATHGNHHRAQALNMLRHCGAELPRLDFIIMLRDQGSK